MIYQFHGSYTSVQKESFKNAQEDDLKKICVYLQTEVRALQRIVFEIFDTREGKQDADPHHSISRASARFGEMSIYRFWSPDDDPHFPHEITHLVAHTWAKPYTLQTELDTWDNKKIKKNVEMVSTSFMQESLAIAVDDIVFKRTLFEEGERKFIDEWCKEQIDQMPKTLLNVVNIDGFNNLPNKIVIPFAASFSKFLLLTFGLVKYKKMYSAVKESNSSKINIQLFASIYGKSDTSLISEWLERLR